MPQGQYMIASIRRQLNTRFIGQQLHYYHSLTSTMEVARKAAIEGATEGTVVIADEQTSGRGRLGRTWLSPEGNLAISVILRPSPDELPQLTMIASLAVVQTVRQVTGLVARIKWPNDVLIKDKKVCGILIESEVKGNKVSFATIGIGININLNPIAFPEISAIATGLSYELGKEVSSAEFAGTLLTELEQLYLATQAGVPVYKKWRENMDTLGKWIRVRTGETVQEGRAETVTECGNLSLRCTDGSLAEIVAGDVTILKE